MKTLPFLLFTALWAIPSARPAAESRDVAVLSLNQALELAGQHHPRLAQSRARREAADQREIQAGRKPNPRMILGTESIPLTRGTTSGSGSNRRRPDYLAGVSQQVRLNGTARLNREIAAVQSEQAALQLTATEREVRQEIQNAFATALFIQESERLFQDRIRILESRLELTRALVDAGSTIPESRETAHADLDHERLDREAATAGRAKAFLALATSLGTPNLRIGELDGELEPVLGLDSLHQASVRLSSLPALRVAEQNEQILRLRADLARASRIPSLNFSVLYRRRESIRAHALDLETSISLPLFDNKKAAAQAFERDADAARARTQDQRDQARLTFEELRTDLALTVERARHIRDEILPHRRSILDRHRHLLEAGDISRLEFDAARLEATREERHYLETLLEAHRLWAAFQRFEPGYATASP